MEYKMKALTIKQPWAWAIAEGLKKYETRSWKTPYPGFVAIHAGRGLDEAEQFMIASDVKLMKILKAHQVEIKNLPFGFVVAVARLVECYKTGSALTMTLDADELTLGDFRSERYAWKLAWVSKLARPVPVLGMQRLWEWSVPDSMAGMVKLAMINSIRMAEGVKA
jgi:hypothetical protein